MKRRLTIAKRTNVRDANTGDNFVLWTATHLTKPAPNVVAVAFCALTRVTDAYTIDQQWGGKMYPDIATLVCCHRENSKWSNIPDSGRATFRAM